MSKAIVSARIPPALKADAEKIFAARGLTPSRAIVLLYELVVRCGGIPEAGSGAVDPGLQPVEVVDGPWEAPTSPMPSKHIDQR